MKSIRCGMLLALTAFIAVQALGADDKGKEPKFDATKLVGTWKYVSGEKEGEKVAADRLKDQTATIDKDKFTLKGPDATFVMKYALDVSKKPVTVKFTMTESPFGAGATAEGVLELSGDELKVCYAAEGGQVPKTFETKKDSKQHLFGLKRSK